MSKLLAWKLGGISQIGDAGLTLVCHIPSLGTGAVGRLGEISTLISPLSQGAERGLKKFGSNGLIHAPTFLNPFYPDQLCKYHQKLKIK